MSLRSDKRKAIKKMAKQIVIQQNQEIEVTIPSGWVNRLKKEISRYGRKVRK